MEYISIYKNLQVTYGELEMALLRLHYEKRPKPPFHYAFVNAQHDSVVLLPMSISADKIVPRIHFAATSDIMEGKGVIAHKDDLAKMIEQERLVMHRPMA